MSRRAILSVHDKRGLAELGRALVALGFELVASGGTARKLGEAGLPVTRVADVTGHPEILGGRVKTLHPAIHGGILARRSEEHLAELERHGLAPIDLVVCNLYPFEKTVADPEITDLAAIEQIDIGGVTLLRAAAKNFECCAVVCDPDDYARVLEALANDALDLALRRRLALKAFRHTAGYDAAIASFLAADSDQDLLPRSLHLTVERAAKLRYGENPHQHAAVYRLRGLGRAWKKLQGRSLSFNNLVDLDAAWRMPQDFERPAVAIIKHTNPSGLAVGENLVEAFGKALACDPVSAFGSIVTTNRPVDVDMIEAMGDLFVEIVAAPGFTEAALEKLAETRKSCRVMRRQEPLGHDPLEGLSVRQVAGGLLVQQVDSAGVDQSRWRVATERAPTEEERAAMAFAWLAVKHVKSNAIIFTTADATVGVGAGQMNRVDSVRLAAWRAGERARGTVMASDAFFPFPDGIEEAAKAGITAVIQPGGSMRDDLVIEAANRLGLAMVFTGERHFLH